MSFLNTGLIFTREVFILFKKVWRPRGPGSVKFDIPVGFVKLSLKDWLAKLKSKIDQQKDL